MFTSCSPRSWTPTNYTFTSLEISAKYVRSPWYLVPNIPLSEKFNTHADHRSEGGRDFASAHARLGSKLNFVSPTLGRMCKNELGAVPGAVAGFIYSFYFFSLQPPPPPPPPSSSFRGIPLIRRYVPCLDDREHDGNIRKAT